MNKFSMVLIAVLLLFSLGFVAATPSGANYTNVSSERATADTAQSRPALAGNVTEITVSGDSITQTWQGYFGNVSGAVELGDASGNTMYNWSLASPQGEVYASTANSIAWTSIECFNWSADGTTLESNYNIGANDVDGVNETFSTGNSHDAFNVGSVSFAIDDCMSTQIYDNTGAGVNDKFEEVLLSDGTETVFVSLLEEDMTGFDSKAHDFEMLVLEDGHSGDTSTTTYYFYVELE